MLRKPLIATLLGLSLLGCNQAPPPARVSAALADGVFLPA